MNDIDKKENPFIKPPLWRRIVVRTAMALAVIIVCTGALAEFSSYFVVRVGGEQYQAYKSIDDLNKVDYIVAPANNWDSVSTALDIYSNDLADTVIISGTSDEIKSVTNQIKKEGLSMNNVLFDKAGIDTYNSIARADQLMESKNMYYCSTDRDLYIGGFVIYTIDIEGKVIDSKPSNNKEAPETSSDSFFNKYYDYVKTFIVVDFLSLDPKYDIEDEPISQSNTDELNS